MKKNKAKNILLKISLVLLLFLLVCGQSSCPTTSTKAAKTGIDFVLISGVDKLSDGKIISQGDTFNIQVHIENYDKQSRSGQVCITDNMDNAFGGIESQCTPFYVKAAEVITEKKQQSGLFASSQEQVQPSTAEVFFPTSGDYMYKNLPVTQSAKAILSLKYSLSSRASTLEGVKVPTPETEALNMEQEPAPVTVSVDKSVSRKEGAYKISLDIGLTKDSSATLYPPDMKEENKNYIYFKASMSPQTLECEPSGTYDQNKFSQGLVELKNTKFIKCSTLVDIQEGQWPFTIDLNYGVELKKEIPFTIKVEVK